MDTEEALEALTKQLAQHEGKSQQRYEKLCEKFHGQERQAMDGVSDKINVNLGDGGMGGTAALMAALAAGGRGSSDGVGLGGGGGILGLVALMALLGRGGLGVGGDSGAAAIGLQSSTDTNTILQSLGDIKASVPLAEAQVQLALAGQAASLTGTINTATIANMQGQNTLGLAVANAISTAKDLAAAQTQTLTEQIAAVGNQVDRNLFQISSVVKDDGEKTRALITTNEMAALNRLAAERQDEIIELRNAAARENDRHGIEINMINNQNQNQLQFQQQAQVLGQLANVLCEVGQIARATNSNVIVGNTGATGVGAQNANPTNVRA